MINRKVSLIFIDTGNPRVKVLEDSVSGEVSFHAPDGTLWQLPSGGRQGTTYLIVSFMKASSFFWGWYHSSKALPCNLTTLGTELHHSHLGET